MRRLHGLACGRGKALSNVGMGLGLIVTTRGQWWGLLLVVLAAALRPLEGRLHDLVRRRPLEERRLRALADSELDLFDALAYYGEGRLLDAATLVQEAQGRDDLRVPLAPTVALDALYEAGLVQLVVDVVDGRTMNRRFRVEPQAPRLVEGERERRLQVATPKKRSRLSPLAKRAAA